MLCRQVGASWRAVSLGGAGGWGPLPVGTAAEEQDSQMESEEVLAQLGWEVEEGVPAARQRWRWACYQAARLAAEEGAAGGALQLCRGLPAHTRAVACSLRDHSEFGCWLASLDCMLPHHTSMCDHIP